MGEGKGKKGAQTLEEALVGVLGGLQGHIQAKVLLSQLAVATIRKIDR